MAEKLNNFPEFISFLSDESQVKLVREVKGEKIKDRVAIYVYTKTLYTVREFMMSLTQIEKLKSEGLIIHN